MKSFTRSANPFQPSLAWMVVSYCVLGFWSFVVLFPLYWLVTTAFKLPIDVSAGPKFMPFIDYQPSLHAWQEMLFVPNNFVTKPYLNTITIGISSAFLSLCIGSLAAYALTRFEYHPKPGLIGIFILCVIATIVMVSWGVPWQIAMVITVAIFFLMAQTIGQRFRGSMDNNDIAFWLISQRMLPPVAVIVPIYMMFQSLRLLDTKAALIIAYCAVNLPLVIWFMRDYFLSIPIELEESAFIDGANRYRVLTDIVIPLSLPGLVATFMITLVFSWNEYLMALFLSGAETQTMPLLVSAQNATRGPQWWNISVLVMLMIVPLILLAIALERYIAKGLLVGAVKG